MADCTSCAAASSDAVQRELQGDVGECRGSWSEVMESRPGMVENWRSSGVATEAAMVSGLAPGRLAYTWSVGKSTFGRSLTGRARYPATPNRTIPSITSVVITGRRMKIPVMFIAHPSLRETGPEYIL